MEDQSTMQTFQRLKGQETEPQSTWDDITEESDPGSSCQVIGFTGAKGGVGTTTVALNVAMALVHAKQRVIYVELSPYLGTAARLLQMPQISALGDSAAQLDDINHDFVAQMIMKHSTGLKVLCLSPWAQEVGYQISTEFLTVLFRELKGLADYVVLDFPLEPSLPVMFFLGESHILNLVLETDLVCLDLAKSQVEFIKRHSTTPIFLTPVNRSGIPPADGVQGIQEYVGYEVPAMIPSVPELCHTAGIKKSPIVCIKPNSVAALQFTQLSDRILSHFSEDGSETKNPRRGRDRRKTDRRDRESW